MAQKKEGRIIKPLKNTPKIVVLTALVMLCILSSNSAIISTSQSLLQDVDIPLTEENWAFADLPEGAIVFNNFEDFIDQLSDLHNESDIGTHSNPTTLQFLDGIYDTLTSDNITIPEQPIYDPETEEFLYNQNAYESWRLDLEGAWTDVDFDEISAELCVFGGTQAEESLKVDIWANDGWINVIPDVMPGWNNVSIAPSIVDESLEMRFTGSDTGNTSVQSSWDIDAVLLHTWTTVYGSEFTQNGIIQDLGNGLSRYIASIGEYNTWNEVNETWHRYLYDPDAKTVKIGNLTITHLLGGDLSIDGDAGSKVGKLSWYIQAYYNDQWNNITLDNYEFAGFMKTADNVTAHQRFWGTQGEMNVYLTYSYFGGFKTRVDIRNDAAQAVPIRAIWAARDVSGLQDNYQLLRNEDDIIYGIQIEDAVFSWNDVIASDNPLSTQTVIDKPTRRAAVVFGNQSTIIPAGYTATIDPSYLVASDAYDNYWNYFGDPTDTDYDTADANKIESSITVGYATLLAAPVDIVPYSVVTAATLTVYVISESGANTVNIQRIDSSDVGALDDNVNGNGGSPPTIDTSPVGTLLIGATGSITSQDIGKLVQESINEAGWDANNHMGFRLMPDDTCAHTIEDWQKATGNHAYITITYTAPSANWLTGYTYRQGHSIDGSTGAGTLYPIEVAVEYGSGTSADGTIYTNEHCDTDFDDIRFTDNDGQTELDYWMEEKTDSDDATFWVEVTDDLGSDQVIYCYYGKSGDSTTSNIKTTFLLGDDFNDASIDTNIWDIEVAGLTEVGGFLHFDYAGAARGMLYGKTAWLYNVEMVTSIKCLDTPYGGNIMVGLHEEDALPTYERAYNGWSAANTRFYRGTADESSATSAYVSTWVPQTLQRVSFFWISGHVYFSRNSVQDEDRTTNVPNEALYPRLQEGTNDAYQNDMDWIYYRKRITTEPAHYTWTLEHEFPNNVPVNDQTPSCTNLDDGDNLYARYKIYNFSISVTDADQATDIDFVSLSCMDGASPVWTVNYTESTNAFSETAGTTYIELTGSVYTKSGVNLDIWFGVMIEWVHPDDSDYDLMQYVVDDPDDNDIDTYSAIDYDYETRVDFAPDPSLSDGSGTTDRGNYDTVGSITASATVEYYQSASNIHPPVGEVDTWVTCPDTPDTDWHAVNYEDTGGTFSVAVDSDDAITGSPNTYTFKVVGNGLGGWSTSHAIGTVTDTYRADRIIVQGYYFATDTNASLNQDVTITVYLEFEYNLEDVIDGTVTVNGISATHWLVYYWNFTDSESAVTLNIYDTIAASGNVHGVTAVNQNGKSQHVLWDRINITMVSNLDWTIIDHNITLTATGEYEYSGDSWSGVITWADRFPSESTVGTYDHGAAQITSITDPTYDITVFAVGVEATVIFDDMVPSGAVAYSWMQYTTTKVYLFWGVDSNWKWDYNDTLLEIDVVLHAYSNGSAPEATGGTYGSGAFGGLTLGHYNPDWYYVNLTINCEASISGQDYDWQIWDLVLEVDVLHSLQITNFNIEPTENYFWITFQTNLLNASITIWDDAIDSGTLFADNIYDSDSEGMHQIARSTIIALHNLTFCITSTGVNYDKDYTVHDYIWWYNITYNVIAPTSYDCHIVILNNLYELIPFDTFEVYKNDSRIYHDIIQVVDDYAYKITIKNRFGDTVNETTFDADYEMVVFVNIYSFKFMSWYNGFLRVNVTRGGVTYSEIIMPMEIIEFCLYSENYDFTVDFLNGTTKHSFNIDLSNSTGYIITGNTLADVFDLMNNVEDMVNQVNITVTTIEDNTVTIQLMFDWSNTTLYNQTINIIAAFDWTNTTLYNQTISIAAAFNATNTVLYDQMILIQNMFDWENTTLFNQTISILNAFNATNTAIYYQTVSILSNISNINTTIYGQTISILSYLWNSDTSIYNQTIDILSQLTLIDSNITANYISLDASLIAINSTLLSNFTSITAQLLLMDSSLLSNFTAVAATLTMIDSSLLSNFTYVMANLTAIGSNVTANYLSVSAALSAIDSSLLANFTSVTATLSMIDSQLLSNFTELTAELLLVNSTLASQLVSVSATLSMLDSSLLSNFTAVSATLSMIDSQLLSNFTDLTAELLLVNSSLATQFLSVSATLSMLDSSLLSNFTAVSATLSMIDSQLLSNFTELTAELLLVNSSLATQFLSVSATLSMLDSSLLSNFTAVTATLSMLDSQLLSNFTDLTAELLLVNSSLATQFLSVSATLSMLDSSLLSNFTAVSATLSMIDSQLLSNFTELTAELLAVNSTIASQVISVAATLSMLDSSLLANFTSVSATLSMIDSSLLSNFTTVTSTLSAIGTNITTNYLAVSATLSMIDSALLSNFTDLTAELLAVNSTIASEFLSVSATLSMLDSSLLSNFTTVSATLTMIDSELLSNFTYVMANLTAIGSNITTNYLSVSAMLSAIDSSLLSNFTSVAAYLTLIDSSLLSNFTEVTATLSAIGTNITTNYLSIVAELVLIDSSLASNFTSVTATLSAIGSNITSNYLAITAELLLIDSNLATNFTLIMTKLIATNSSIFTQTLLIISDLEFLNATMYLIDDPTHLNPLVLGYSLEEDYCDITIVSSWHNATISVYDNEVLVAGPTSELLCPIRYVLSGTAGSHNLSILVDGGADSFWYNISYYVDLVVSIEDWGVEDVVIEIVGITNADISWYVYNEGVYSGESGTESADIGFHFDFAKNTEIGKHNFSIYFNSTNGVLHRWFNGSYTISAVYAWQYIEISDQTGQKINYVLDVYVNGSLLYAERFFGRMDHTYEIAIFDKLGDELFNTTYSAPSSRQYNITLSLYSFKIKSWLDGKILVYLYSSGGGSQSTWLAWDSEYEWFVFSGKSYQMKWETDSNTTGIYGFGIHYFPALDSHCLTPDPTWYTPTGPVFIEIDAYGIAHLYAKIPDAAGGGGDFTESDAEMVAQSLVDEFNPLLLGEGKGRLSLVIIGIFGALAYGQYFFTVKKISKPKPQPTGSDKDKDPKKPTTVSSHQGKNLGSTSQSRKKGSSHR